MYNDNKQFGEESNCKNNQPAQTGASVCIPFPFTQIIYSV